MSGRKIHVCKQRDEMGEPLKPLAVVCGANSNHSWCERCDPCPAALCHWCHGRGYSIAPLPRRQRLELFK